MSGAFPQPSVPQGDTPQARRMGEALREIIATLVRSGLFLLRLSVEPIITPGAGTTSSLKWGALNRVYMQGDFAVQLPRLRPEFVGVPLKFIIINDTSNVIELVPTGSRLSDSTSRPLINGVSTLLLNVIGYYVLENDGQNWFARPD